MLKKLFLIIMGVGVVGMAIAGAMTSPNSSTESTVDKKTLGDTTQLAEKYCESRKTWTRTFPLFDLEEKNGKSELIPQGMKTGKALTNTDCVQIITALIFSGESDSIQDVIDQKMWVGMSKFVAAYNFGTPERRISDSENGDAWVFNSPGGQMIVYFKNDKVVKWVGDK